MSTKPASSVMVTVWGVLINVSFAKLPSLIRHKRGFEKEKAPRTLILRACEFKSFFTSSAVYKGYLGFNHIVSNLSRLLDFKKPGVVLVTHGLGDICGVADFVSVYAYVIFVQGASGI